MPHTTTGPPRGYRGRVRYADLPRGFVITHRGGALQVPENTLAGHRVAVQRR